jgi:HlyD family secretion protein
MAEKSSSSSRGLYIGVVVTVVAVLAIFGLRAALHQKVSVRTATATLADLTNVVSTNGKVEPVEDFQSHAPGAGVVEKLYVDVGSHVQTGQQLLSMDDSDARSKLASAQASLDTALLTLKNMQSGGSADERYSQGTDLANARAQERNAATTLAATEALQAKGSASPNEVAVARQKLTEAQTRVSQLQGHSTGRYSAADIAAQQSQVAQARAAVQAARSAYAGVDIRAPFSGTVYSIPVSQFDFVQFGEALLNLADLNRIRVRAYFDEPDIGKLSIGQQVKIVWDAKPYATWHGHIERAPTTVITYGTRNVGECIISVDDAKGELLPNTNVTVTVTTSQLTNVLTLPHEAVHTEGQKNFVYRIVDGHLRLTPVQLGAVNLTRVQITGGLGAGDVVALNAPGNAELKDGLDVKAIP